MMQYLVVESDPMDPLEAQRRLQQLSDYLALDSYGVVQSVPRRHVRAASVHYPIREVEIVREDQTPVYDVRRYRTVSRNERRIPTMEERVHINRTPLFRLACPSVVSTYVPHHSRRYPAHYRPLSNVWTPRTYSMDDNSYKYWPLRQRYGTYEYDTPPSYYDTIRRYPVSRKVGLSANEDASTTRSHYYPSSSYNSTGYSSRPRGASVDYGDRFVTSNLSSSPSGLDELSPLRRRIRQLLSQHKRRV